MTLPGRRTLPPGPGGNSKGALADASEAPELFLQGLEGALHALAGRSQTRIRFARGAQTWGALARRESVPELRLPGPPPPSHAELVRGADPARLPPGWPDDEERRQLRGIADQAAFQLRFHDPALHRRLAPEGGQARQLFDRMEQARSEGLGMSVWRGAAGNISAASLRHLERAEERERRFTPEERAAAPFVFAETLAAFVRAEVSASPLPPAFAEGAKAIRAALGEEGAAALARRARSQTGFAEAARNALARLNVPGMDIDEHDPVQTENDGQNEGDEGTMSDLSEEWDITQDTRDRTQPELEINPASLLEDEEGAGDGEEEEDADARLREDEEREGESRAGAEAAGGAGARDYRAFTAEWDRVEPAAVLCPGPELDRLRDQLDRQLSRLDGAAQRLANRLQRKLLARQSRWWQFDLEDGLLDAARLSRVVVDPAEALVHKMEREADFRDTVVTLLLDNSGSMRGRPITVAALSADILARALERCNVRVEILGFTTAAWKGGRARERWQEAGRPASPGRLNELLHIVYKPAETPFRRARRNLALMLRDGLLKENIDGEALLWAHERLLARPEQRRILMVISDGAPVDDSTLSANPGDYLERHLKKVIAFIERRSPVELLAIGIGHDVTRYYRRAVTISDVEDLGGVMVEELTALFDLPEAGPAAERRAQARNRAAQAASPRRAGPAPVAAPGAASESDGQGASEAEVSGPGGLASA